MLLFCAVQTNQWEMRRAPGEDQEPLKFWVGSEVPLHTHPISLFYNRTMLVTEVTLSKTPAKERTLHLLLGFEPQLCLCCQPKGKWCPADCVACRASSGRMLYECSGRCNASRTLSSNSSPLILNRLMSPLHKYN